MPGGVPRSTLYPKKISGRTYYYLREMARVNGKPKMVSERAWASRCSP